jgi:hypothetical protein
LSEEEVAVFEVAYSLGMPVHKVMEMPYDELLGWFSYFEMRPVGWRDDLRTHYNLQVQGSKHNVRELFPSLAAVLNKPHKEDPADTLKGSFIFHKMAGAIGGDKLDIF